MKIAPYLILTVALGAGNVTAISRAAPVKRVRYGVQNTTTQK
jgi:hypothetical protein